MMIVLIKSCITGVTPANKEDQGELAPRSDIQCRIALLEVWLRASYSTRSSPFATLLGRIRSQRGKGHRRAKAFAGCIYNVREARVLFGLYIWVTVIHLHLLVTLTSICMYTINNYLYLIISNGTLILRQNSWTNTLLSTKTKHVPLLFPFQHLFERVFRKTNLYVIIACVDKDMSVYSC